MSESISGSTKSDTETRGSKIEKTSSNSVEPPVIDSIPLKTKIHPRPPRSPRHRPVFTLPRLFHSNLKLLGIVLGVVIVGVISFIAIRAITNNGCDTFNTERTTIGAIDGLSVTVLPEALRGNFGVKVSSVPSTQIRTSADAEVKAAFANLPITLKPQSDLYIIAACGSAPKYLSMKVNVPNGVSTLSTLDLYTWDTVAQVWRWIGGAIDSSGQAVLARTTKVPANILLVQSSLAQPVVGAEISANLAQNEAENSDRIALPSNIVELNVSGLYLGDLGDIAGDRSRVLNAQIPATNTFPALRNWNDRGEVNQTLLRTMLADSGIRDAHISNLVNLVEIGNYSGVKVAYRGVEETLRNQYTDFVVKLAAALQSKGKQLILELPAPIRTAATDPDTMWLLPGYDVDSLATAVDVVEFDLSTNPTVFDQDTLDSLMKWLVARINRYRLQLVVSSLSVRQSATGSIALISFDDALEPLGRLEAEQPADGPVQPGAIVRVRLHGSVDPQTVKFDEALQTYNYSYVDVAGIQQTVWLGTASSLRRKLDLLSRYHIRGVTVRDIDSSGNADGVVQAVVDYGAQAATTGVTAPVALQVAWSVNAPDGSSFSVAAGLDKLSYDWTAPNVPGDYTIGAALQGAGVIDRGAIAIQVAAPATATPTPTNTPAATATASPKRATDESASAAKVVATATPKPEAAAVVPAGAGGGFELGGHVTGLSHVAQMKYAGMTWVKIQIVGFQDPSGFIAEAHAQGMKVLIGAKGDKNQVLDESYQNSWAQHLASIATAGADAIEVWNEPNIDAEWPAGQISGASYTRLLAKAYNAIKAAHPSTIVISAALAPTGYFGGGCSSNGCDDSAFLPQMVAAGAQNYADCIGAHHNAGTTSPTQSSGAATGSHYSWYYAPTRDLYFNAFGGSRKVCFTELGYVTGEGYGPMPGNFSWASNITLANQAQWLAEAASLSASSGRVRLMIIWNIDFTYWRSGDNGDPQAGYAIIRPDGSCPACETLKNVMGSR